jgi:hypothetical protein
MRQNFTFFCLLLMMPCLAQAQTVACPMYALRCPDGSAVSPMGPDCHLPACPDGSRPGGVSPPKAMPVCNMGPKHCPDGSLVSPGPNCSFAPCPGEDAGPQGEETIPDQNGGTEDGQQGTALPAPHTGPIIIQGEGPSPQVGTGVSGTGIAAPAKIVNMADLGLAKYPDEPLDAEPAGPRSVSFVIDHRSALNGKTVTVHGTVISFVKGGCPTNPMMKMPCMLPRVVLAEVDAPDRDQNRDLAVMLPMDNKQIYEQGQPAEITGIVSGNRDSASMRGE